MTCSTGLISCNTLSNVHPDMQKWCLTCSASKLGKTSDQNIFSAWSLVLPYGPFTQLLDTDTKYCSFLSTVGTLLAYILLSTLLLILWKWSNKFRIDINTKTVIITEQSLSSYLGAASCTNHTVYFQHVWTHLTHLTPFVCCMCEQANVDNILIQFYGYCHMWKGILLWQMAAGWIDCSRGECYLLVSFGQTSHFTCVTDACSWFPMMFWAVVLTCCRAFLGLIKITLRRIHIIYTVRNLFFINGIK